MDFSTIESTSTLQYYLISGFLSDLAWGLLIGISLAVIMNAVKGRKH